MHPDLKSSNKKGPRKESFLPGIDPLSIQHHEASLAPRKRELIKDPPQEVAWDLHPLLSQTLAARRHKQGDAANAWTVTWSGKCLCAGGPATALPHAHPLGTLKRGSHLNKQLSLGSLLPVPALGGLSSPSSTMRHPWARPVLRQPQHGPVGASAVPDKPRRPK